MSVGYHRHMQLTIAVRAPFDLALSLAFLRSFPPCRSDYRLTDDSVTAAVTVAGRVVGFRLSASAAGGLVAEVPDDLSAAAGARLADLAGWWLSAADDLTGFYQAAAGDAPAFRAIVAAHHGLHQVRFLTLEEITVYAVLMQRTPIAQASRLKQRFLARFGHPVTVGDTVLRAMPAMSELASLDVADHEAAIGHRRKAAQLPAVIRGVAALGEAFLRSAPYADARDALIAIPGVGPFTAAAILLRGLGRMDEVPLDHPGFAIPGRAVYGAAYDPQAIARRYGADLGYWSYYLKHGAGRVVAAASARPRRRNNGDRRDARQADLDGHDAVSVRAGYAGPQRAPPPVGRALPCGCASAEGGALLTDASWSVEMTA